MSSKFTTSDGDTTICFEYTAPTAKAQAVVGDCAEALFDRGRGDHGTEETPVLFVDLSNQEKLDIVDSYIKEVIVNMANDFKLKVAKKEVIIEEHNI